MLNTPFIPVDEDPDFHINGCEEGWPNEQESGDDEPFPAEKGDGEDTQQSFHTSFSSYSQQRRDGRPERPNPWHAVSQPSLLRHNMIERKPTMQSTQYFQQYVEPESLVKGYERRRREFLASNPELEENEDLKIEMGWYWTKKRHTKKQEDAGMSSFAATIPEGIFDAPQTGTSAGGEFIPPSFEGAISEASSCTLRNETPETEEESKELIGPIELVEWIPSQKHQQIMAMYCVDSDDEGSGPLSRASTYQPPLTIERSSKEKWEASSHSSLDTDTTTTQQRLKWAQTTLVASPLRKRKFEGSDREQSDFEIDKVEETPPPSSKRSRFSLSSSNMDSIPETPTHSQNRRQYVPSSDIDEDDLSSISSEDTPVRTTERRTWKSKIATPKISASRSNRKVSLNEFRELPLLPERSLSEILMARFGGSITSTSTPERNVPGGVEYSTPSAATSTPKASPSLFSDNEQFQNAFNIAFNSWMSEHGESMVQAAVQAAVEKEMQKMTAARDVDRGIAKETVNERRDEEVVEVQDSQGWTDDDEL